MKVLALDRIVEGVEPERAGAVLILECEDLEEARGVVDALPLTRRGLVGWDLIPLGPFIPLESLFSTVAMAEGGG